MIGNTKKNLFFLGMVLGTAGFLVIAYLLARQPELLYGIDGWGEQLHQFVSAREGLANLVILVTSIGNRNTYIVLCALFAVSALFMPSPQRKLVIFILCTFILTVIGNDFIKGIFERERPDLLHLVHAGGFSFPSGHAMNSMVFFGLLAYFFSGLVHKNGQKIILAVGFAVLILCIAISRVAVGVHYISDISAGLCIGLAIVSFALFVYEGIAKK